MPHRHCIANYCTSDSRQSDKDTTFFQLPKVDSVRLKWLQLARRDELADKFTQNPYADIRHLVVCSKHFVDGHPSVENPFPTIFTKNEIKKTSSRKKKNSLRIRLREPAVEHGTHDPAPVSVPKKRLRLVKLTTDKSDVCYPYVAGEVEFSDTCISTVAADIRLDVPLDQYTSITQDHTYVYADPARKYCQVAELQDEIASLQKTCSNLIEENARLRAENNTLKQTSLR